MIGSTLYDRHLSSSSTFFYYTRLVFCWFKVCFLWILLIDYTVSLRCYSLKQNFPRTGYSIVDDINLSLNLFALNKGSTWEILVILWCTQLLVCSITLQWQCNLQHDQMYLIMITTKRDVCYVLVYLHLLVFFMVMYGHQICGIMYVCAIDKMLKISHWKWKTLIRTNIFRSNIHCRIDIFSSLLYIYINCL